MRILAVSFVTRPGSGSEGGVGWAMLKSAAEYTSTWGGKVDAVIDARDLHIVQNAIEANQLAETINLFPVRLPTLAENKYGDSRSRGSYLAWLPAARKTTQRLCDKHRYAAAHQFTFATASMPSIIRSLPARTVWGPLAIAQYPALRSDGSAGLKERLGIAATSQISKRTTENHSLIVAQNSHTGKFLDKQGIPNVIEPNVVVEPRHKRQPHQQKITFSGHLIERKRPWVCLKVIQNPRLRNFRLHFVGDGPLRSTLESYVRQERLDAQVTFEGRLTRDDALESVASSTLLLLPSSREGAPWVVGEAAAMGVPSLVSDISGAGTVVELSGNMGTSIGEVEDPDALADRFAQGAIEISQHADWSPTSRWSASRMPSLLDRWWEVKSH